MKGKQKFFLILLLGLLSAIGPFSIDMYLPGFPDIAAALHTTVAHVALSLSSFFIGISAGQLLYGPLLDRFGVKKPLYIGLAIYILSSVGCALANSADMLILLRLLQALGGCVGMVASRAMVRSIFPVHENAKVFSMLMLVIGVSPIIAPTLGGYVTATIGWQYIFVVLAVMVTLILIALYLGLPEGKKPNPSHSLKPRSILNGFLLVLKEPQFYTYVFTGSIASAGLYAYLSGSPYVFMNLFHVTERQYGGIFALIAAGLILSSQVNSFLLRRWSSEQIVRVALCCQSVAGIALFAGTILGWIGLFGTIFFIFIFLSSQGFTFPNTSALSLAPFLHNAGSASAVMGTIQMSIGALASAMVSILSNNTALPMTGVMCCCALSSFIMLMIGRRIIRYKTNLIDIEEQAVEMISTS